MPNESINDEAKKVLISYKQLVVRKQQMENVINRLEKSIQSIKGPNFDSNCFSGGNSSVAAKIARLVDLKAQFEHIEVLIYSSLLEIEKVLMLVAQEGVLFANILHYKFIEFKTIDEISETIKYSRPQSIRKYNAALRCFYRKFKEVKRYGDS